MNTSLFRKRKRASSGVAPFTPLDVAGCVLWLDADDPATLPNSPVDTWLDKSGLDNDASQATGANRPTLATWPLNSRTTLEFNGTSHFLTLGNPASLQLDTDFTLFTVSHIVDNISQNAIYSKNGAYFCNRAWDTVDYFVEVGGDSSGYIIGAGSQAVISSWVVNSSAMNLYVGGVLAGSDTLAITSQLFNIGVGGVEYYSAFFTGYISEIVVYSSGLGAVDRQALEGYLASKWGL